MRNEQDIRRLMQEGMDDDESPSRALSAVSRARRQVGQRDTLAFALVDIWSVLAGLLAPVLAFVGRKQAETLYQQSAGRIGPTDKAPPGGENDDR